MGAKNVKLAQENLPADLSLIGTIQSTVPYGACPQQDLESNRRYQGCNLYRVNDRILLYHNGEDYYTCFYLYS